MKIDSKAIKQLADLLEETGLNEIEVADGDKAIRVSKGGGTVVAAGAPAVFRWSFLSKVCGRSSILESVLSLRG